MPVTDHTRNKLSQVPHKRLWLGAGAAFAAGLLVWPMGALAAWSGWPGGEAFLNLVLFLAIFALVGCLAGLGLGVLLCFFKSRHRVGTWLAVGAAAFLIGSVPGFRLFFTCERAGWQRVIARGEPLVAAIHAFERRQGQPPEKLSELVPGFLPEVPTTGVGSSPEFHYERAGATNSVFGDRWTVRVRPPQVGIGFDMLFYTPGQNYPKRGFGGGIEQVGRWAYVHE